MAQPYLIPLSNNKITTQQLLFIQNYISNGFNATQAAIDANYHSKSRDGVGKQAQKYKQPERGRERSERINEFTL